MRIYLRISNTFAMNPKTDHATGYLWYDSLQTALAAGRLFREAPVTSINPTYIPSILTPWPTGGSGPIGVTIPRGISLWDARNNVFSDYRVISGSVIIGSRIASSNEFGRRFGAGALLNQSMLGNTATYFPNVYNNSYQQELLKRMRLIPLSYPTEALSNVEYLENQHGLIPSYKVASGVAVSEFFENCMKWNFIAPDSSSTPNSRNFWCTIGYEPYAITQDDFAAIDIDATRVLQMSVGMTFNLVLDIPDSMADAATAAGQDQYFILPADVVCSAMFSRAPNVIATAMQLVTESSLGSDGPQMIYVPLRALLDQKTLTATPALPLTRSVFSVSAGLATTAWTGAVSSLARLSINGPEEDYLLPVVSGAPPTPL